MEDALLHLIGEGKKAQTTEAEATPRKLVALLQFAYAMGAAYAAFVLYVSATYPRSWLEKLQMLPLCIVALTAPMMCTTMIGMRK